MASKPKADFGRFAILEPDDHYNIIASSEGPAGSGKSHWWLTAPDPLAYFLFEPGGLKGLRSNPLFRDRFDSGGIRVIDFSKELNFGKMAKEDRVLRALEVMEQFQEDWDSAIGWARTIVWDKEEYVWEMIRYAHDEVDSPTPKNFHELNLMMHGWVSDAEKHTINFGLLRGIEDTWGKIGVSQSTGKAQMGFTGVMRPRGHKKVPDLVQINLSHTWNEAEREFEITILDKCRLGNAVSLMGKTFGAMDFPMLAQLLYPESEATDWGLE